MSSPGHEKRIRMRKVVPVFLSAPVLFLFASLAHAGSLERALAGWSRIVDLTHPARQKVPLLTENEASGKSEGNLSRNLFPETYLEAPLSPNKGRISVDKIPLRQLMGFAVMVNVVEKARANPDYALTLKDLEIWERRNGRIPKRAIILIFTGWSRQWQDQVQYWNMDEKGVRHFPGISKEAVEFLLSKRQIHGIGIDTPALDPGESASQPVHELMVKAGKYQLKNLANLDKLPPKGATLIVAPLPVEGGYQAPTRVLAILP